eukprot:scaffold37277_cov69-Phaeocystis_antarctica.AAC.1
MKAPPVEHPSATQLPAPSHPSRGQEAVRPAQRHMPLRAPPLLGRQAGAHLRGHLRGHRVGLELHVVPRVDGGLRARSGRSAPGGRLGWQIRLADETHGRHVAHYDARTTLVGGVRSVSSAAVHMAWWAARLARYPLYLPWLYSLWLHCTYHGYTYYG